MKHLPIFLSLEGQLCVVVGGGNIAHQKVSVLLRANAQVKVISPEFAPEFDAWIERQSIRCVRRAYEPGDLRGARLAFAATDDASTQAAVVAEAAASGVLVNVVDVPELCGFVMPAILEQQDLVIAVSTGGASPALARQIRDQLVEQYDAAYGSALRVLAAVRRHATVIAAGAERRKEIFTNLATSALVAHIRRGDGRAVDQLLADIAGDDVCLASIGVDLP